MMTPKDRAKILERLATTPHESGLTKELMWRKSDLYNCLADIDELSSQAEEVVRLRVVSASQLKEIEWLNAENIRLKQESTERADKIRYLVGDIDGAGYWPPLDAVAHLASEVKRLRAENEQLKSEYSDLLDSAVDFVRRGSKVFMPVRLPYCIVPAMVLTKYWIEKQPLWEKVTTVMSKKTNL